MNTTRRNPTHVTAWTALLAAGVLLHAVPAQASTTGAAAPVIVQLPRVVVTGQVVRPAPASRVVARLPRVVITGQRADRAPAELVQAVPEKQAAAFKQGA